MKSKSILKIKPPDETNARYHHMALYTPETTLPAVKTKEGLQAALAHYSVPFIRKHTADSAFARRHYVERVRPALRWFCKKFGVNPPAWLAGNAHYDKLSPEEHEAYFGKDPLEVREFEEKRTKSKEDTDGADTK